MGLELRSMCLTDFNIDVLYAACSFRDVDVALIPRVGGDCENLGGELGGIALGVGRLGSLASRLLE